MTTPASTEQTVPSVEQATTATTAAPESPTQPPVPPATPTQGGLPPPVSTPTAPTEPLLEPSLGPGWPRPEDLGMQAELERRQAQIEQAEQRLFEQGLAQATEQYAQRLETTYGLASDHARALAQERAASTRREYELQRQLQDTIPGAWQMLHTAINLAEQHGLALGDLRKLMGTKTVREMQMTAQALKQQSAADKASMERIKALEEQVKRLTQGTVPPQKFDSNQPGVLGVAPTPETIDDLYMNYERQFPNRPNPYAEKYRKFLATGQI